MVPIICIVGYHKSGKTTFIEALIPELKCRGYRVGTIKHDVHGFEIDQEGKDTWRHRKAGSTVVALSSHARFALIKELNQEISIEEVVTRFFGDVDIVLVEGFKQSHYPKIEIFRKELGEPPIATFSNNVFAVISEDPVNVDVPLFPLREVNLVADLIEQRYLANRRSSNTTVLFNGKRLPMNDFVTKIVENTIIGLCSTLRGWNEPSEIVITIRRREHQ
ncbi:MAG: molybdopterin-guanine dinucleotide biosynthesis protein B [Syntrophobacterales bacterium]|nr:molybdopterin-guanine dinucleotide biosynthesis protein B [Syntrophobacterales bacterium]